MVVVVVVALVAAKLIELVNSVELAVANRTVLAVAFVAASVAAQIVVAVAIPIGLVTKVVATDLEFANQTA